MDSSQCAPRLKARVINSSKPPSTKPMPAETPTTTSVSRVASCRVGQTTLRSSIRDSRTNCAIGFWRGVRSRRCWACCEARASTLDLLGNLIAIALLAFACRRRYSLAANGQHLRKQAPPDLNRQPPVLETGALPIELGAFAGRGRAATGAGPSPPAKEHSLGRQPGPPGLPVPPRYFVSRCAVCVRQRGQYLRSSMRSGSLRLFL